MTKWHAGCYTMTIIRKFIYGSLNLFYRVCRLCGRKKGLLLIGGIIGSILLTPIIAPIVAPLFATGSLYGAAATTSGLANLGLGSIAAGGFGMKGGLIVLSAVNYGISYGIGTIYKKVIMILMKVALIMLRNKLIHMYLITIH